MAVWTGARSLDFIQVQRRLLSKGISNLISVFNRFSAAVWGQLEVGNREKWEGDHCR